MKKPSIRTKNGGYHSSGVVRYKMSYCYVSLGGIVIDQLPYSARRIYVKNLKLAFCKPVDTEFSGGWSQA